jgi:hypothetical protein
MGDREMVETKIIQVGIDEALAMRGLVGWICGEVGSRGRGLA